MGVLVVGGGGGERGTVDHPQPPQPLPQPPPPPQLQPPPPMLALVSHRSWFWAKPVCFKITAFVFGVSSVYNAFSLVVRRH